MARILFIEFVMRSSIAASGRSLFLIFIISAFTGCSHNSASPGPQAAQAPPGQANDPLTAHGGYDAGGGDAIHSPPALVIRTIEMVQNMASESSWEKNVFKHYFITFGRNGAEKRGMNIDLMFAQYSTTLGFDGDRMAMSPPFDAISRKKINLLEKGDCPKPKDETSADASVTKHNLDGEVCFSVGNLTRVAPSDLTRQVMGLMLHEAVHLAGGDEVLAIKYQENFNVYFGSRFGEMIGESYLDDVGGRIYENVLDFVSLQSYVSAHVDPALIYARFGKVYGQLINIQGIQDPIALRVRLFLPKPDTSDQFVKNLKDLIDDLDQEFRMKRLGPHGVKPHSYEELDVIVKRQSQKMSELHDLWVKLEKEALCNDGGKYFKPPEAWVLSDVCSNAKN